MTGFLSSANGQGHVAGDGPNGHVPFSCLEVVVAAEDVTSVLEKEMSGRFGSSFESDVARAAGSSHAGVLSGGYVAVAIFMAQQSASLWLVVLWCEHHLPPLLGGWRDVLPRRCRPR